MCHEAATLYGAIRIELKSQHTLLRVYNRRQLVATVNANLLEPIIAHLGVNDKVVIAALGVLQLGALQIEVCEIQKDRMVRWSHNLPHALLGIGIEVRI